MLNQTAKAQTYTSNPNLTDRIREIVTFLGTLNILFVLVIVTEVFTPYLIWQTPLPSAARFIAHAALLGMIAHVAVRALIYDSLPVIALLIIFPIGIWSANAILRDQGFAATGWGVWVMFQFPIAALYAYRYVEWPKNFSRYFEWLFMAILVFHLLVQFYQYGTGVLPGDGLAGAFGENGTGRSLYFLFFMICLGLGKWISTGEWLFLAAVFGLTMIASVLSELKAFPPGVAVLSGVAMVLYILNGKPIGKLIPYAVVAVVGLLAFSSLYNAVVGGAREEVRDVTDYLDFETLNNYLNRNVQTNTFDRGERVYDIGRNYALQLGWNSISYNEITTMFGLGIGARGESRSLGTAGQGFGASNLGLSGGSTLLTFMQEFGVIGLTMLGLFFVWVIIRLFRDIRRYPTSPANTLRYAVILFTILWPFWAWYGKIWLARLPMLVYWMALGYVMYEARMRHLAPQEVEIKG